MSNVTNVSVVTFVIMLKLHSATQNVCLLAQATRNWLYLHHALALLIGRSTNQRPLSDCSRSVLPLVFLLSSGVWHSQLRLCLGMM